MANKLEGQCPYGREGGQGGRGGGGQCPYGREGGQGGRGGGGQCPYGREGGQGGRGGGGQGSCPMKGGQRSPYESRDREGSCREPYRTANEYPPHGKLDKKLSYPPAFPGAFEQASMPNYYRDQERIANKVILFVGALSLCVCGIIGLVSYNSTRNNKLQEGNPTTPAITTIIPTSPTEYEGILSPPTGYEEILPAITTITPTSPTEYEGILPPTPFYDSVIRWVPIGPGDGILSALRKHVGRIPKPGEGVVIRHANDTVEVYPSLSELLKRKPTVYVGDEVGIIESRP